MIFSSHYGEEKPKNFLILNVELFSKEKAFLLKLITLVFKFIKSLSNLRPYYSVAIDYSLFSSGKEIK